MEKQEGTAPVEPPLPLPPSAPLAEEGGGANEGEVQTEITVDGVGVIKLDRLGPIIINTDGSLTRIANWAGLSEAERHVALRRIAKRNQQRREQLEKAQLEELQG